MNIFRESKMEISKLIQHWNSIYFSDIVVFLAELIALVVAFMYIKRYRLGRLFIFYILFDALILIVGWLLIMITDSVNETRDFTRKTNLIIGLTELLVYSNFFVQVLTSKTIKRAILINCIVFSIIVIIYFVSRFNFITERSGYVSYLIGVVEFIFLIIPCLFYYRQLLVKPYSIRLLERPSFWIVTGIFFFSLVSVPFYLINKYLTEIEQVSANALTAALFYTPFTLNFIFLTKAFLCKKPLVI